MNSQLIHIFDNSACLTKRQLKGYVDGSMTNEESHAVEVHLNSCPFCNAAVEGLFAQKEGDLLAVDALNELNTDFLKDHFSLTNPQIHLNSIAPAAQQVHTIGRERKKKGKAQPLVRITSIAAALALVFGVLWFFDYSSNKLSQNKLAQQNAATGAADAEQAIPGTNNNAPATTAPVNNQEAATIASAEIPTAPAAQPASTEVTNTTLAGEPVPEPQRPQALLLTGNDDKKEVTEEKSVAAKDAQPAASNAVADAAPAERRAATEDAKMSVAAAKAPAAVLTADRIESKSLKRQEAADDADPLEEAHELYAQKKYSKALSSFKKQMKNGSTAQKQEATIMAARCYINLGDNGKAEELLKGIVEEGGPQKKAAKKLLKQLNPEE